MFYILNSSAANKVHLDTICDPLKHANYQVLRPHSNVDGKYQKFLKDPNDRDIGECPPPWYHHLSALRVFPRYATDFSHSRSTVGISNP